MSNIYLEYMEERVDKYGIDKMQFTDTELAILALVLEVRTLNKTLEDLEWDVDYIRNTLQED